MSEKILGKASHGVRVLFYCHEGKVTRVPRGAMPKLEG